jgi:tripartite-type tricarboxylate transporter receptor subunit TctC
MKYPFLLAAMVCGLAQAFPERPIQFIVTAPPGGSNDIFARAIARRLGESLGKPVIVDNRAGATGYAEINKALAAAEMKEFLLREGAEPAPMTPEAFGEVIRRDIERLKNVARSANIQPE